MVNIGSVALELTAAVFNSKDHHMESQVQVPVHTVEKKFHSVLCNEAPPEYQQANWLPSGSPQQELDNLPEYSAAVKMEDTNALEA